VARGRESSGCGRERTEPHGEISRSSADDEHLCLIAVIFRGETVYNRRMRERERVGLGLHAATATETEKQVLDRVFVYGGECATVHLVSFLIFLNKRVPVTPTLSSFHILNLSTLTYSDRLPHISTMYLTVT